MELMPKFNSVLILNGYLSELAKIETLQMQDAVDVEMPIAEKRTVEIDGILC